MYNRFFGFKERPFKLVPNPEFVYLSRIHEEVLAHLNYAAGYGEGFVEITGEVGTGKTTLCRMFLESLDENTAAAYIFNPKLDALQLLKAINDEFGVASDTGSLKALIDRLNAFLLEKKTQGKRVILLVDEAQNLSTDVLEQLRLLSNLETTTSKLLQIILVGQPELGELLETDALRQLNQRITLSCHLMPLDATETREYIRHRIHIASKKPGLEFTAGAHRTIFRYTGGVPRLINIACDRALLTAFTLGKHRITNRIVKRALHEMDGKRSRSDGRLFRREKLIIGLLSVLVILVAGLVVGQTIFNRSGLMNASPVVHHKVEPSPPTVSADPAPAVVEPPPEDAGLPPHTPVPAAHPPAPVAILTIPAADPSAPVEIPTIPAAHPSAPVAIPAIPAADPSTPVPAAPADMVSIDLPTPSPPIRNLAQVIAASDAIISRTGALKAVLEVWNAQLNTVPVDGLDNDTFFRVAARHSDMETLRARGNLNLIRKLNLPAIVEFPPPDGSSVRFLAVVGLAENEVRLSDGQAVYSFTPAAMVEMWNGVAHILWKNYFNYTGVIPITSPGEVIIGLKLHLKALGFPVGEMNAAYDIATRRAIETIQARNGLTVDGMVGPQTKIAIYNADKSLDVPRLTGTSGG